MEKAAQILANHPRCKRRLSPSADDEPEFAFSAEGDDQREIRVTLLTFVIPKKS